MIRRSLAAAAVVALLGMSSASADPGAVAAPSAPGANVAALGLAAALLGNHLRQPVVHAAPAVIYPPPVAGTRPSSAVPRG
jgi:hypothetical protein